MSDVAADINCTTNAETSWVRDEALIINMFIDLYTDTSGKNIPDRYQVLPGTYWCETVPCPFVYYVHVIYTRYILTIVYWYYYVRTCVYFLTTLVQYNIKILFNIIIIVT